MVRLTRFFCDLHDDAYLGLLQLVFLLDAALLRSLAHKHLPVHVVASSIDAVHDAGDIAYRKLTMQFLVLLIFHHSSHELHRMRLLGVRRVMNPELSKRRTIPVVLLHVDVVDDAKFEFFEFGSYIFHGGHRECFGNENGCHD